MKCPDCGGASAIVNSRHVEDFIRRRRECKKCQHRFSTKEIMWDFPLRGDRLAAGRKTALTLSRKKIQTAVDARRELENRKDNAAIDE